MEFKTLSNGCKMPVIGLGTWLSNKEEELMQSMEEALEAGYRHFDTANLYMNEAVIGKVLNKWLTLGKVQREELFVTTKLPTIGMVPDKVSYYLNKSLENLQLDYVDLYLVHIPFGMDAEHDSVTIPSKGGDITIDSSLDLEGIWESMEELVHSGKAKSIGVSNFEASQVERIVNMAKIPPANLQVEMHAYLQKKSLRAVCDKYGIAVCASSPTGLKEIHKSCGPLESELLTQMDSELKLSMLKDPVVLKVASRCCKDANQVLLRFLVQKGIIVIPKSTNAIRLKENMQLFDFLLTPEEMESLEGLDQDPDERYLDLKEIMPIIERRASMSAGNPDPDE